MGFFLAPSPFRAHLSQMASDSAIASATDPVDGKVRGNSARMQAYRLREVAFRFALDVAGVTISKPSEELCSRARDFAACVKAWSDTNTQARIERGRPLPGSLRPERKQPKRRTRAQGPLGDVAPKPAPTQPVSSDSKSSASDLAKP